MNTFLSDENYGWLFPNKVQVRVDNNLGGEDYKLSNDEYREFVKDYVFELQKTKIFVSPSFSIKAKLAYSKDKKAKTVFPLGIIPISLYNTLRVNALVSAIVTVDGKVTPLAP